MQCGYLGLRVLSPADDNVRRQRPQEVPPFPYLQSPASVLKIFLLIAKNSLASFGRIIPLCAARTGRRHAGPRSLCRRTNHNPGVVDCWNATPLLRATLFMEYISLAANLLFKCCG